MTYSRGKSTSQRASHFRGQQAPRRQRARHGSSLPSEITSPEQLNGLVGWYTFDDTQYLFQDAARTTPVTADNDPIGGVTDRSGQGQHMTQATAGLRPLYKTAIFGAKSVARMDGTDDYLQINSMPARSAFTWFMTVQAQTDTVANATLIMHRDAFGQVYYPAGGNWNYFSADNGVLTGNSLTLTTVALRLNSASSFDFWSDGGTGVTRDPNDTIVSSGAWAFGSLQSSNPSKLQYGEIIIYNSALSVQAINLVGNYLERWGTTWTAVS